MRIVNGRLRTQKEVLQKEKGGITRKKTMIYHESCLHQHQKKGKMGSQLLKDIKIKVQTC